MHFEYACLSLFFMIGLSLPPTRRTAGRRPPKRGQPEQEVEATPAQSPLPGALVFTKGLLPLELGIVWEGDREGDLEWHLVDERPNAGRKRRR